MDKKGYLKDGGWMERMLGEDYGEFLRETTTLWAISRMSGTGLCISQDIQCGQTCRRGEMFWRPEGALMPTSASLG